MCILSGEYEWLAGWCIGCFLEGFFCFLIILLLFIDRLISAFIIVSRLGLGW